MARLTPLTDAELTILADASEESVHEWREHAERARKGFGTLSPSLDQILAIQRQARAMLEVADALLTHKQLAEMRQATETRIMVDMSAEKQAS